jgi:hypothetical protein
MPSAPNFCGIELTEPYGRLNIIASSTPLEEFHKVEIAVHAGLHLAAKDVALRAYLVTDDGVCLRVHTSLVYSGSDSPKLDEVFRFFMFAYFLLPFLLSVIQRCTL